MWLGTLTIVIAVTIPLLLAEAVLRLADRPAPAVMGWTGGRPAESNEFGFRGRRLEASAKLRIVLLGDSQVEAGGTVFDDMPEAHLRRAMMQTTGTDVSVVSIGSGGWGQDQQLLSLMAHIRRIHPAVVVLWFTARNDLWNNTFPTHFPADGRPKPTFWLEGAELKGPNAPWLSRYRPPGLYLAQAVRRVQGFPNYPTDREWERHLPLPYRPTVPTPGTPSLEQTLAAARGIRVDELPYFRDENFENEKTHYSLYLVPESQRLTYAAALTRALLLRIRSLCEANGAKFFVLDTDRWENVPIPEAPTLFEVRGKGFEMSSASARRIVGRVLDGLPTIQVRGVSPGAVVSKIDNHLSGEGNRYVMESLASQLVQRVR